MESAEIALCITLLHVSGGTERGQMMLGFGSPMLLQNIPFCRPLAPSLLQYLRSGCAWGDVLGQEVLGVVFEGMAYAYGDMSSCPAGPGTVLSLAESVMFIQCRTGNGWGDISSPETV